MQNTSNLFPSCFTTTHALDMQRLCDLAMECTGNPLNTIRGLVAGVIERSGDAMDDASLAALIAVRDHHLPNLADAMAELREDAQTL